MSRAGFPFLFGIYGKKATRDTVSLLKETGACGVLLLARNIETAAQTRALTEDLVQRVGRPLIFSIDHEGGWVLRFRSGVTPLPGNCALGRAGDGKLAYATGRQMALELRPLGIQLNLAPVLDVLAGSYNPGIGIRSFGADASLAGRLGAAMIRGMQDHGVAACAKHFPGKGAASVDAHVSLPTIRNYPPAHLRPFQDAVEAGVACVMTSHVRYPKLDSKIVTLSEKITRDILRKKLGFDGVIIADDLCMGAVTGKMTAQEAAARSFAAGHDLLIIAHDVQAMADSPELLELAVPADAIERSCRRIETLFDPPSPKKGRAGDGEKLARRIARLGVRKAREGTLPLPLSRSKKPLLVVFPDFKEVSERFTFEGGPRGPEDLVAKRLKSWGPVKIVRAPIETDKINGLAREAAGAERVLFFCFEARRFPGQRAALKQLAKSAAGKTALCLIRGEWDLDLAPRSMTALDAGGYRLTQLDAALDSLLS
jgi:beta-N-acetylhexosaminidase